MMAEGVCRGCLLQCEDIMELLQYTEKNRRLYVYCTGLQVKRNDAFPFQLCKGCYVNMKLACKFKKQCRTSDKQFKNYLNLKDKGEVTNFSTYLKNCDDTELLRFPLLNGMSYESSFHKPKDDDVVSTSTSIRNFVKDLLEPDDIPDTEARIIREVIEEEADVLDDTLDSHWLQDDVSIDTDFRFSFSPFSTPRTKTNNDNSTPKRETKDEEFASHYNYAKKEINKSDSFIAAKRILLKTENKETGSIPDNSLQTSDEYDQSACTEMKDESEDSITESSTDQQVSEDTPMEIDHHTFIASKRILLNYKKKEKTPNAIEELRTKNKEFSINPIGYKNVPEIFMEDADLSQQERNMVLMLQKGSKEMEVGIVELHDKIDGSQCSYRVLTSVIGEKLVGKTLEQALIQSTEDAQDKDSIDKNLEKALQCSGEEEFSLNAIIAIATPSIHPGASGASTPMINRILFGENLEYQGKNSDPQKAGHTIENYQNVEGTGTDILEDFFNKETGEYIGVKKELLDINEVEEFENEELEQPDGNIIDDKSDGPEVEQNNLQLAKLGKAKYDLSDMACKICDKKFDSAKGLRIHFCKVHNYKIDKIKMGEQIMEITCDVCGKIFNRMSYLRRHLSGVHKNSSSMNEKEKISCKYCLLEFSTQGRLMTHMKTHKNVTVEKKSPKHKRKVQVCHICGYESTSLGNWRVHVRRHNKQYDYECKDCGATFYRKSDYTTHARKHNGERPYKCPNCPKMFSRSDVLNRHMKLHTGERDYRCVQCDSTFISDTALKLHTKGAKVCRLRILAKTKQEKQQCYVVEENKGILKNGEILTISNNEASNVVTESEDIKATINKTIEEFLTEDDTNKCSANSGDEGSVLGGKSVSNEGMQTPTIGNEIGLHMLLDEDNDGDNQLPLL